MSDDPFFLQVRTSSHLRSQLSGAMTSERHRSGIGKFVFEAETAPEGYLFRSDQQVIALFLNEPAVSSLHIRANSSLCFLPAFLNFILTLVDHCH